MANRKWSVVVRVSGNISPLTFRYCGNTTNPVKHWKKYHSDEHDELQRGQLEERERQWVHESFPTDPHINEAELYVGSLLQGRQADVIGLKLSHLHIYGKLSLCKNTSANRKGLVNKKALKHN